MTKDSYVSGSEDCRFKVLSFVLCGCRVRGIIAKSPSFSPLSRPEL